VKQIPLLTAYAREVLKMLVYYKKLTIIFAIIQEVETSASPNPNSNIIYHLNNIIPHGRRDMRDRIDYFRHCLIGFGGRFDIERNI
jgi:hypothetical protein